MTKNELVQYRFERVVEAIGGRVASNWNDVGGYILDYAPVYGGYCIRQISNSGGGQSSPFGDLRYKPTAFIEMMDFTLRALEIKK